jgi:hypothetical protein
LPGHRGVTRKANEHGSIAHWQEEARTRAAEHGFERRCVVSSRAETFAAFERRQPVPQDLPAPCATRGSVSGTRQRAHEPCSRGGRSPDKTRSRSCGRPPTHHPPSPAVSPAVSPRPPRHDRVKPVRRRDEESTRRGVGSCNSTMGASEPSAGRRLTGATKRWLNPVRSVGPTGSRPVVLPHPPRARWSALPLARVVAAVLQIQRHQCDRQRRSCAAPAGVVGPLAEGCAGGGRS